MKTCTKCRMSKSLTEFWADNKRPDGKQYHCKECQRRVRGEAVKRWRQRNPEKFRNFSLRSKYGLTVEDVAVMEREQSGCCLVCGVEFGPETKPVVDHCHATRAVRGLLCKQCNFGLGMFGDKPEVLRAAAEYLEREY
jgi:Autographiviridae endonuclease VII